MKDGGLSYACFCCTFLLRGWTLLNARSAIRRLIHCENVEREREKERKADGQMAKRRDLFVLRIVYQLRAVECFLKLTLCTANLFHVLFAQKSLPFFQPKS